MALDPETIQKERDVIPQMEVTGTVGKSVLVEHTDCIDTYTTHINTGVEKINFQYNSLTGEPCTIDAIFDIQEHPFAENTKVHLSLSQNEPHIMVTSDVLITPKSTASLPTNAVLGAALFFIVGITICVLLYRKNKNVSA